MLNELYTIYNVDGEKVLKDVFFSKQDKNSDIRAYLEYKKLIGVGGTFRVSRDCQMITVTKFGK